MAARPGAPTTLTATVEMAQSPRKLGMIRRHRSHRDVKKKKSVAGPLPSFSYVEGSKHVAEEELAHSPTNIAAGLPHAAAPGTSLTTAQTPVKSRSRASRASDALSKLSLHFFKTRRASDSSDKDHTATTPAASDERRFWPRRLTSEKKVTPAAPTTTPTPTSSDLNPERRNSVQASAGGGSGKSDATRDPQSTGASSTSDARARPVSSSKSRVKPSPDASRQLQRDGRPAPPPASANTPPFTPQFVFQSFANELTELEKSEVLEYGEIYFFSSLSIKSRRRGGKIYSTSPAATANAEAGDPDPDATAAVQELHASEGSSSSTSTPPPAELFNDGYDDERGDYLVLVQDHLAFRFEVLHTLGAGSFGQVVCCLDHQRQQRVAVKIIRNRKRYREQSLIEVQILSQLQRGAAANSSARDRASHGSPHIIEMREYFLFRGHLCIVFELLGINLYEYLKLRFFQGLPLANLRDIAVQLVETLRILKAHRVIHCDLKPENILIKPAAAPSPARATTAHASAPVEEICLIDFGSSCFETAAVFTYIQSRFYRSPEVILGFPYSTAIDMWSLGCILAELHTGHPVFAGENEVEQLACIMELLGPPSHDLLAHSRRRRHFFNDVAAVALPDASSTIPARAAGRTSAGATAVAGVAFVAKPFVNSRGRRRAPGSRSLASAVKSDDRQFLDFVRRCLVLDPRDRMTPDQAARDPWLYADPDDRDERCGSVSISQEVTGL